MRHITFASGAISAIALLFIGNVQAEDATDLDALSLADKVPNVTEQARDWRAFIEGAYGQINWRATPGRPSPRQDKERLSLDVQYDHVLAPDWRAVLADRLDISWPAQNADQHAINTLREAYLSWKARPATLFDLGRINVRNGVATGYNPTDFFRADAVRSVVSIEPASLKENRLGSLMLRGQQLWDSGSLTALYSPKLNDEPSSAGLNPDVGATNHQDRWLLSLSQKVGGFTPQWLVYHETHAAPQFGFNLTGLVNDSTVAFFEWSGGRSSTQLAQALATMAPACACDAWHDRLSTGLTYTTPSKLSLTAEYHYDSAALNHDDWNALRRGSPAVYGLYRNGVQTAQELPTQQELFLYAAWQDALIPRLDLSLMHNLDLVDSSRRLWLEARYHVGQFEYALQWQRNSGHELSDFGAAPEASSWQGLLRYYF
jgi:hypothetical protein